MFFFLFFNQFIYLFVCLFILSCIQFNSFIHLFIYYLFICFICLFIYSYSLKRYNFSRNFQDATPTVFTWLQLNFIISMQIMRWYMILPFWSCAKSLKNVALWIFLRIIWGYFYSYSFRLLSDNLYGTLVNMGACYRFFVGKRSQWENSI